MEGRKNILLRSVLLVLVGVALSGVVSVASAAGDDGQATQQELQELRKMVQELAGEVKRLKAGGQ